MEGHRVRECLSLGSGLEQPFPTLGTSMARSLGSSLEQPPTPADRRRIFLSTCSLNSFSSGPATLSPTRRKISLSLCSLNSNLDMLELDRGGSRSWRRSSDLPEMSGGWVGSGKKWTFLSYSLIPPPGSWQPQRFESHGEETRVERSSKDEEPEREQEQFTVCGQYSWRKTRSTCSRPPGV